MLESVCTPARDFMVGAYSAVIFASVLLIGLAIRSKLRRVPARHPAGLPLMIEADDMQLTFDDYEEAAAARDAVLARVVEHNEKWSVLAIQKFHELKHLLPADFIGEDIRLLLIEQGGIEHRPKAWGSLTMLLQRGKQIERTGAHRSMVSEKANAKESRVYRLVRVMEDA